MTTAQGLRKVAAREWAAGNVVTVRGLQIGVRFKRPYLKESFQVWMDEEPDGELASKLYVIGINSLDPVRGHGYVELTSQWVTTLYRAHITRRVSLCFSSELTEEIQKWLRREHEMRISELVRQLEETLRDAHHAGDSVEELASYGRTEVSLSLCLEELGGGEAFGRWIRAFLASKEPHPSIMPSYI